MYLSASLSELINFKITPYYLAQFFDIFIKRKLNTYTSNSIKNTNDFIHKINKISILPG